ncbi:cation:proton antiporter [Ruficoccus sp. ZRK36]|uniref:cation:proton antiporter domain-containing protein n=1 Tax=Ruficoccus sp. ZRK36 TaxID=2866311 RepID=UPI001C73A28C|nr:cation:proton antiporter [Ruficoccus sp. ZRK36]QYY35893.1 cation:proton antiporter [Ruficoccus sp. ZRK36]
MEHGFFIGDLAIVLMCAAAVSLVFQRIKLPVFLGYLVSGFLIGPNLWEKSPIHDLATVNELSELGVIFLMFYIGLEFDLRRLRRVMGPAVLAVTLQTVVLLFVGAQIAPLLGWTPVQGIFLGSLLAISSSMVTVAVLRDLGRLDKPHAQLTVGVLILEDILAVTLLVVLSGIAVSGEVSFFAVGKITFFIAVFVVVTYYVGKLIAPHFLDLLNRIGSIELITLSVVALMLGVSVLAMKLEFSEALGAFLAGSILSQTPLAHRIENATEPLRNIFCAVFFVAIGMLIEPHLLMENWQLIVGLSLLVVLIKVLTVWGGFFLAGQNPDTAFRAAVAKAQIGEFSFIIAAMGQKTGVTGDGLVAVAVGVSLLSTLMALGLTVNADPIYKGLAVRMPKPVGVLGRFYRNFYDDVHSQIGRNSFLKLAKRPVLQILFTFLLLNGIVLLAYILTGSLDRYPVLAEQRGWLVPVIWWVSALLCLPFITAILRNLNAIVLLLTDSLFSTTAERQYFRGRLRNIFNTFVLAVLIILLGGLYLSLTAQYLPGGVALAGFFLLLLLAGVVFWKRMVNIQSRLELLFMESFNRRAEIEEPARRQKTLEEIKRQYPWPVSIRDVMIKANADACGKRIRDLDIRKITRASIIALGRAGQVQYDPGPGTVIFPLDHLYLFGSEEETNQAMEMLQAERSEDAGVDSPGTPTFKIETIYLDRDSEIADNTLAGANLRKDYGVTVLGIQRGERRITGPLPDEILQPGDVLYVTGNSEGIRRFQEQNHAVSETITLEV